MCSGKPFLSLKEMASVVLALVHYSAYFTTITAHTQTSHVTGRLFSWVGFSSKLKKWTRASFNSHPGTWAVASLWWRAHSRSCRVYGSVLILAGVEQETPVEGSVVVHRFLWSPPPRYSCTRLQEINVIELQPLSSDSGPHYPILSWCRNK